jgi:hypothetical protein
MGRHGLSRTDPARKPAESTSGPMEAQRGRGVTDGQDEDRKITGDPVSRPCIGPYGV